jgi:hypothetical protein
MAIVKKTGPAAQEKSPTGSKTPSWAKRGKAATAAMEQYEKDADKHFAEKNRMWRFWIPKGESARVTFVDGNLLPDGTLDILTFREHSVQVNGDWEQFVCIAESEPCPLCEGGDFPSLVGVLTIIDHRTYKGKKGVYKDTPKLYVAKKNTIKLLQQMATKRDGLAGATFEISRLNDSDPNVGGSFDFEEKGNITALQKQYTRKGKDGKTTTVFVPADYEKEIVFLSGKELRAKGFGSGKPIGSESAPDAEAADAEAGKHM